jgi:CRISPR-associated endonuclease/helicase Cas3
MLYPFDKPYQTNLIDLLTENGAAVEEFGRRGKTLAPETRFRAALASAAQKFEAIDAGTRGVLVPYTEEGMRIIVDFCAAFRTPDGMIADAGNSSPRHARLR